MAAKSTGSICERKSTHCLRIPLRSIEQIYLIFLIPILLGCAIYVINFSADLVVAIQHYRDGNLFWGSFTIALMYAPAIVYFVITVSRPDWWMNEDEKITNGAFAWFAMQILQLVAFPMFALYRYAGLIVLAVDATLLNGEERKKTLNAAAAPAAIELYFFLQAWFQAAPQAIFQTHLLFREYPLERTHQTVVVHMLCILMSIVVLSVETASFQRFESQRINGRKLPWATWLKKYRQREENDDDEQPGDKDEKKPLREAADTMNSATNDSSVATLIDNAESSSLTAKDLKNHDPIVATSRIMNFQRQLSTTPPLPPKNLRVAPPPAPIRGITTVATLPIPEMPAPPRPDSIVREQTQTSDGLVVVVRQINNNADTTGAPTTMKNWRAVRIPRRKYSSKGLDMDDPIGKFVAFVWWFFFITARVFSIAIFYEFHDIWLLGIVAAHYFLMCSYLFYHAKYYDVTNFFLTLWLGFVYVFGVIEYRVKFKYADLWLVTYYTFVIVQNSLMTVTWFVYDEWNGFWYTYMFFAIFASMGMCIMSAGVYNVFFKPKKRRVYAS